MSIGVQAFMDQLDAKVKSIVLRHGWFIQYVGGGTCTVPGCRCGGDADGPAFAYTVGLFGMQHPELLIFGVTPDLAGHLLNDLGRKVKQGEVLLPGQLVTFEHWQHRVVPEDVPNPEQIVFTANRYYGLGDGLSVPVLQLSYDDVQGRFPWEEGYAAPGLQPRPGTFSCDDD